MDAFPTSKEAVGHERSRVLPFRSLMDTDFRALLAIAQAYFDAAWEMDADKFASIFDHSSCVTKVGEDGNVSVLPVEMWLAAVRNMKAPKQLGLERRDEILSIDVVRELALLKLKLQIPPRHFTDMLSCLKVDGTWKIAQKVMTTETR
jgi:putative lumazine-binding protein